ncbi:hypothetical protein, partial [Streptosporangium sp. NPDC002607]
GMPGAVGFAFAHLPQSAPVFSRPSRSGARCPLFWTHANLYGTIQIDVDPHLGLGLVAQRR